MSTSSPETVHSLALSVYETVFRGTDSFRENNVGPDLAYLLGAILKNSPNDAHLNCEADGRHETILEILKESFPPSHEIWAFVRHEASPLPDLPVPALRVRKLLPEVAPNLVADAISRCSALDTKSLEEFLDSLLDEDLDVLAQLPGTPGQVLTAQFAYYIRSSVNLTEALKRNKTQSQTLIETLYRLPEVKKRRRNSRSPDHDPAAPDPEAAT